MTDATSRFRRTLRDLAVALLNATLLLIAVCLFLGLRLADRIDDIPEKFAAAIGAVSPLRSGLDDLRAEYASLRSDIASVQVSAGGLNAPEAETLAEKIAVFNARMDEMAGRMEEIQTRVQSADINLEALVDHTIETTATEVTQNVGALVGCVLPETTAPALEVAPAGNAGAM